MGAGIAYTFVRKLGTMGEDSHLHRALLLCLLLRRVSPGMLFSHAPMSLRQLGFLMLAGLCGCIAQFAVTRAYLYAPAKELSVYDYTQVIFATLWGFLLFWPGAGRPQRPGLSPGLRRRRRHVPLPQV